MLCVGMGMCAGGRLKRHWTNRTLVEDFTVRTLDVRLQCGHIRVHNIAMYTSKTNSPCVVQTVLGDVGLEVHRPADGPALGAGVGRFVLMDSLVGCIAALVGKQHLADSASLLSTRICSLLEMRSQRCLILEHFVALQTFQTMPAELGRVFV